MGTLYRFIIGIFIGAGAILPGISSGVLCVIFGIYDKLINCVLGFFKDIKENSKFLLPIIIGVAIGVIVFGNLLKTLFNLYPTQTKFAFIGLILGCVPNLFKIANSKKGFKIHYLIYTFLSFGITIFLLLLEHTLQYSTFTSSGNTLFLVLSGFVMSIGIVVPGVSSTVLLMILNTYEVYLDAVSTVNISVLIPMGLGVICGGILFLKITEILMRKFFSETYYTIIGFVLGSLLILYPRF